MIDVPSREFLRIDQSDRMRERGTSEAASHRVAAAGVRPDEAGILALVVTGAVALPNTIAVAIDAPEGVLDAVDGIGEVGVAVGVLLGGCPYDLIGGEGNIVDPLTYGAVPGGNVDVFKLVVGAIDDVVGHSPGAHREPKAVCAQTSLQIVDELVAVRVDAPTGINRPAHHVLIRRPHG